ncbi:hypothetical protein BJ165DRAFT_1543691 [Panaeolus papilionaceus]|nr:hypothetical protein BJ165DRAFT_1543691 [Panaeolus papilionaceus]
MLTPTKQVETSKKGSRNLPIEIYQLIIDKIYENTSCSASEKLHNLRACSLVCLSFVALCQRHIFAEAQVGAGVNNNVLERNRLAIILQDNTQLAGLIKRIVHFSPYSLGKDAKPKIPNDPCLSVLLHLPQVQCLDIICDNDQSHDFGRGTSDPYGASHFFQQYITSSTLTSVAIQQVKFLPLDIILLAPNLRRLQIFLCGISSSSSPPPPAKSLQHLDLQSVSGVSLTCFQPGMQLETLRLSGTENGFLGPVSFSEIFPTLKNLEIHTGVVIGYDPVPGDEKTSIINHIFENTSHLECLVVQASLIGQSTHMPLQVQQCVANSRESLQQLHLYYSFEDPAILWEAIYDIFSAVQNQNIIEEIDIIVFYYFAIWDPKTLRETMLPTLELWSKLDKLLDKDISLFPCLRKVHVKVLVMEPRNCDVYTACHIDREELNEFGRGAGCSFRWLLSDPEIEFKGQVGIHHNYSYTFPEAYSFSLNTSSVKSHNSLASFSSLAAAVNGVATVATGSTYFLHTSLNTSL